MTARASVPEPLAALDDRLRTTAAAVDAAGRPEAALAGDLARAGAFSLFVPAELGGAEAPVPDALEVIEWVAERSGSVGWCVMIGATTGVLAGWLPHDGAEEIYGSDPEVVTGGAYAPTGRAVASGDGYRVSGHWEWGSGSQHCGWLLGGAVVTGDDGAPHLDASGSPQARLCFAPAEQVRIVPNWEVLGMRGTGSHDLVMDDVEVPTRRTVSLVADRPWATGPLYRFPPFGLLALGIAAVSLGVGRAAVDAAVELAASKVPMGAGRSLGARSTVRAELSRCEARLRAARALLHDEAGRAWAAALAGDEMVPALRAGLRLAAVHAAEEVAEVCSRVQRLAGGSGVREGRTVERCFRDAHTATAHVLVSARIHEAVGAVLLGGEPGFAEL